MNSVSFFEKTTFSLSLTQPVLPSHSNHQLERLFIDLLLPSASSSPSSTPVSFISCALPPLVSRAVGQRERDVTGTENVRKWGTREMRLMCRNELRRQPHQHEKDWQETMANGKCEFAPPCVHVGGACVHARCEIRQGKEKVEEAQLQRLLISKCYRDCATAGTFFLNYLKASICSIEK